MTELQRAMAGMAGEEWPKPLPVMLAPAPDEALSSWVERHAAFCGLGPAAMRRHCAPDAPSLRALDRALTPEQEERLSHLFRLGSSSLRQMTHEELGREVIGLLVGDGLSRLGKGRPRQRQGAYGVIVGALRRRVADSGAAPADSRVLILEVLKLKADGAVGESYLAVLDGDREAFHELLLGLRGELVALEVVEADARPLKLLKDRVAHSCRIDEGVIAADG